MKKLIPIVLSLGILGSCATPQKTIIECNGAGCWTVESDLSIKKNIMNLSKYGLKEVMLMKPREYDYKETGNHSFGFIAQELKLIVPEIVYGEEGSMSIGYGGLTPILVKAIQEQQIQIQQLKLENTQIKSELCLKDKTYSWCKL